MAAQITPELYPVAIACLPPIVATLSPSAVIGQYLVLNTILVTPGPARDQRREIGNTWMTDEQFWELYSFVEEELEGIFIEVERI